MNLTKSFLTVHTKFLTQWLERRVRQGKRNENTLEVEARWQALLAATTGSVHEDTTRDRFYTQQASTPRSHIGRANAPPRFAVVSDCRRLGASVPASGFP